MLNENHKKEFTVNLDKKSLNLIIPERKNIPDWAKLDNHKCPNCPLDTREYYCPTAVSSIDLIEFFEDSTSIEETDVKIEADDRTYFKHTTLQQGVSSILGLCMATSGCPVLGKLKPMARFHYFSETTTSGSGMINWFYQYIHN